MNLIDNTVYETTREVCTTHLCIPEGTLLKFGEGEPHEWPQSFTVYEGPFMGAEVFHVRDIVEFAGLVEVIF